MAGAEVLVDRGPDLLTLTVSNPTRRNALTMAMYATLEREFRAAADDHELRAVVLKGAAGHFAGGTDINELRDISTGDLGVRYESSMRQVQQALLDLRVPIIAVVDGVCVGGGLVFAALSDIVYCTPRARFGSPIARTLGNTLSASALARLHSLLGRRRTAMMLMTGALIDAEEAFSAGFVTEIVDDEALADKLGETVDAIRRCAPESIWSFKEFERRLDDHVAGIRVDDVYRRVYDGADFQEGVKAFLAKRPSQFRGRTD